jgi:rubredoxin
MYKCVNCNYIGKAEKFRQLNRTKNTIGERAKCPKCGCIDDYFMVIRENKAI